MDLAPLLALAVTLSFGTSDREPSALAAPGDVDGDGAPDLVVARRGSRPLVWVLSGRTGRVIHTLWAPDDVRGFGCDVDGAGDVDGDGRPDVVVGADDAAHSRAWGFEAGRALVYSGRDGALLHELCAPEPGGFFGRAVAGGGDLDGDGGPDLAVGDPENGRVLAFSGADGRTLFVLNERARLAARADEDSWGWGEEWRGFGGALAIVPDVDGDARAELLVGAHTGSIALFSGADGARLRDMVEKAWNPVCAVAPAGDLDDDGTGDLLASVPDDWTCAWSGRTGERLLRIEGGDGSSIAALGDLDGDGCGELAVGAKDFWNASAMYEHVFSGRTGELAELLPLSGDRTEVCGLGDVNGDGVPELALYLRMSQLVRIISGADMRVLREVDLLTLVPDDGDARPLSPAELARWEATTVGELGPRFGSGATAAGDVDGDGDEDVMTASRWRETGAPGTVSVRSGRDGRALFELRPEGICLRFGSALHAAGDVDADGVPDLLVGADDHPYYRRDASGRQVTLRGVAFVFSGADGRRLLRLEPPEPEGRFGASVAGGEDLDGDAVPDLVVTAPSRGGRERGAVHVFSGVNGALVRTLRRAGDPGGLPDIARFGQQVVLLPDEDGDGVAELAAYLAPESFRVFSGRTGAALGTRYGEPHHFAPGGLLPATSSSTR